MYNRYNYRLYPNKEQEEFLKQSGGSARFVWNYFVGLFNRNEFYVMKTDKNGNKKRKIPDKKKAGKILVSLKKSNKFLYYTHSQVLQQTVEDFRKTVDNYFKNKGGRTQI